MPARVCLPARGGVCLPGGGGGVCLPGGQCTPPPCGQNENITFPPVTVADSNKRKSRCHYVTAIKIRAARDFLDVSRFGMPVAFFSSDNNFDQ